ncbi:hypothetical protein HMPREF3226_02535 [Prevotella corporis]|uniref:Uncharacterized protein n=1 Tax=Prevotella corporis TaxID=28128 RepID=A0A133PVA2_9BACT|nr:hypothetical protein HMPREF3226_02535 [Prevotella corporis]
MANIRQGDLFLATNHPLPTKKFTYFGYCGTKKKSLSLQKINITRLKEQLLGNGKTKS